MIGALIGGAASVIGGLFGSKKQKTETTVDYVKMAQNAEAAGFNPLTALRNGGSAGFTSTVHHPGLSALGAGIANAGASFGAALDQRLDPIQQKRNKVESALLDYQLGTIQNNGKSPMMFGDVPTKTGQALRISHRPEMSNRKAPGTFDDARFGKQIVPGDAPTVSSMGWTKNGWHENPNVPDAGVAEQVYGEVLGSVYGVGKLAADAWQTWKVEGGKKNPDFLPQLDSAAAWMDKALGLSKSATKGGRLKPAPAGGGW